jgi:hypothetical protein
MLKRILIILVAFPSIALAQWTSLACVNPTDNFTVSVEFDEKGKRVRVMGTQIVHATFTPTTINFTTLPPSAYLHVINRSNGAMMIQNVENERLLIPYQCSLEKKKF